MPPAEARLRTPPPSHTAVFPALLPHRRLRSVADLAATALVSRAWLAATHSDLPWRSVYIRLYGEPHTWEACTRCAILDREAVNLGRARRLGIHSQGMANEAGHRAVGTELIHLHGDRCQFHVLLVHVPRA